MMISPENVAITEKESFRSMLFGQRIAYIIETKGISKAWIAEKLGISKQALNYLLKHSVKPKFIDEFAELLELNPQWVEHGTGEVNRSTFKNVPVLSDVLPISTELQLLGQDLSSDLKKEYINFSHKNIQNFIAFKLNDDANFPPFVKNSILIFDKQKKPIHEDFVLFVFENKIFVRQYVIDMENVCYKANNSLFKTFINTPAKILGVLVEARYLVKTL